MIPNVKKIFIKIIFNNVNLLSLNNMIFLNVT